MHCAACLPDSPFGLFKKKKTPLPVLSTITNFSALQNKYKQFVMVKNSSRVHVLNKERRVFFLLFFPPKFPLLDSA